MSDDPTARILGAISELRSDVHLLRSEVGTFRTDVMERMDRPQDRVTTQHEVNLVNFAAAERAEQIARGMREQIETIGGQVSALVRQVQLLNVRVDHLEDKAP